MKWTTQALALLSLSSALISCDKITDVLLADPQRSSCTAYCEWAVSCHAEARDVDEMALMEQCLTETQARDDQCKSAETTGIDSISSKIMADCVDDIDAVANDCSAITGDAIEINTATAPGICLDPGLFNTARAATAESNDELCVRVSETLCTRSTSCLESFFNIPADVLGMIEPAPQEQCLTRFDEEVTTTCRDEQLYALDQDLSGKADIDAPELPDVFFSVNENREAARACLTALADLACDELFSGMLPPVCAGAFSDPTAAAGALNGFACGLGREELNSVCE